MLFDESLRPGIEAGTPPEEIADVVVAAVWEEGVSILPHPGIKEGVRAWMTDILEEHYPRLLPPGAIAAAQATD